MSSTQKTHFIVLVVAVTLAIGGLIFMTKQIGSPSSPSAKTDSADSGQVQDARTTFVNNCNSGASGTVNCDCVVAQLEAAGYEGDDRWKALNTALDASSESPQTVAPPADYQRAFNACHN